MKLTAHARSKIPGKEFAGPGRSYPIENDSHARDALARASQQHNAGRLSDSEYEHIVGRAHAKLRGK